MWVLGIGAPATAATPTDGARAVAAAAPGATLALTVEAEHVETLRAALQAGAKSRTGVKVPAMASDGGAPVEVRLGLLGNWSERLEAGRWPLTVRTKGDGTLFGIERFALRAPAVRGYQAEILMLDHARREGVLAPRVEFVRVSMNGDDLGLMKLNEHLDTELVEAQQRRKGAILRFRNGAVKTQTPGLAQAPDAFLARPLIFERETRSTKSGPLAADRELAVALLAGFLEGTVPAREVFDVDLVARFLAVCELWRAIDAVRWPNLRFYFNPVTKRLEPLAYEASPPDLFLDEGLIATSEAWPAALLRDEELGAAFDAHAVRIARETIDGVTEAWIRGAEAPLLAALRAGEPQRAALDLAPIAARAKRLVVAVPVAVAAIRAEQAATHAGPPAARKSLNPIPTASRDEVLARHGSFLSWDAASQSFDVRPGVWQVNGSLVLPVGAGLRAGPGTTLRFGEKEFLLAHGPLSFTGSAEAPVVLEGLRDEGPEGAAKSRPWQGIVVLHSAAPHRWEHVVVRAASGIDRDGWTLTGGVTFRASEVVFVRSRIEGSRAEDALNLIRSRFKLEDLEVVDSRSDGFDGDFSSGVVERGRFANIGGDAIDVSGADVTVNGTVIEHVHDKGISVGERSQLVARGVRIESVGTGFASKDGSTATIEESQLRDVTHAALMAYVKKSEYGPASLLARRLVFHDVGREAVAQTGSRIEIDGALQSTEAVDVENLYSEGYMKRGSKAKPPAAAKRTDGSGKADRASKLEGAARLHGTVARDGFLAR